MEAVHVLLWSDGVAYSSLVDVLWGAGGGGEGAAQQAPVNR